MQVSGHGKGLVLAGWWPCEVVCVSEMGYLPHGRTKRAWAETSGPATPFVLGALRR